MDSSFDPAATDDAARHQHELLQRSRQGDPDAFGELALDHRQVALRVAVAASRSVDPEDVVAEALTRIWASLRAGGGPETAFGPYLRATVRNVAITMATREREQPTSQDHLELALQRSARAESDGFSDLLIEHSMIAEAYASLPERWRQILWEVDVQGRKAAEVGAELGLSPNSAAALTKRARQGLSRAWLQQLIESGTADPDCEWVRQRAGGYVRDAIGSIEAERIRAHLDECPECTRAFARLVDLGRHLRVAALIAGGSAAAILPLVRSSGTATAASLVPPAPVDQPRLHARGNRRLARAGRVLAATAGAAAVVVTVALAQAPHGVDAAAKAPSAAAARALLAQPTPRPSTDGVELGVWMITPETSLPVPTTSSGPVAGRGAAGNGGRPHSSASAASTSSAPRPTDAPVPSGGPTSTGSPTGGPPPTATPEPATPSASASPTGDPSASPTVTPTAVVTAAPELTVPSPTDGPTATPTPTPTALPTSTADPTTAPTSSPSADPTDSPSPSDPPGCWHGGSWLPWPGSQWPGKGPCHPH